MGSRKRLVLGALVSVMGAVAFAIGVPPSLSPRNADADESRARVDVGQLPDKPLDLKAGEVRRLNAAGSDTVAFDLRDLAQSSSSTGRGGAVVFRVLLPRPSSEKVQLLRSPPSFRVV